MSSLRYAGTAIQRPNAPESSSPPLRTRTAASPRSKPPSSAASRRDIETASGTIEDHLERNARYAGTDQFPASAVDTVTAEGGHVQRARTPTSLTRTDSLAAHHRSTTPAAHTAEVDDFNLGRALRGLATGDWAGADIERRVMSEGTSTAGGHMVPTPLAATVIDLARASSRVIQAGALTIPMDSQTLKYARLTSDPAASWHTENAAITATDPAFDSVTLTAQTLTVLVKISLELLEDAINIDTVVQNTIAQSIALEFDRVALRGSGTAPEPRGIRNQSGVTVTAFGGANGAAPTNYDHLLDAFQILRGANFDPTAVIQAPRSQTTLAKLKDTTNQPLAAPADVAAVPRLLTNQVPVALTTGTSTDTSEVYVGQWDKLLIGLRTQMSISLLRERYMDNGQFAFFAYLRGDVQLARPTAFNVITGIRP